MLPLNHFGPYKDQMLVARQTTAHPTDPQPSRRPGLGVVFLQDGEPRPRAPVLQPITQGAFSSL